MVDNNDEETPFPAGVEMIRPTNSAAVLENDDNNGHILPNNFHNSDDDDTHHSKSTYDINTKAAAGRFGCLGSSRKYKWLSALIVVTFIICALAAGGGIKTAQDKKRAAAAKTLRHDEKPSLECDTIVDLTAAKAGKSAKGLSLTTIVGAKSVKAAKAMSLAAVNVGAKSSKCKSAKATEKPVPAPEKEEKEEVDWAEFIEALNGEDTEEEVPVVVEYSSYGAPRGSDEAVEEGENW